MVNNSRVPLVRLEALHALDGAETLNEAQVIKALQDADERVREHAAILSEKFITNGAASDALWEQLRSLAFDSSGRVRYQLAFALGEIRRPEKTDALTRILRANIDNQWIRTAVLSSLNEGAGDMFVSLAGDARFANEVHGQEFVRQLADMIAVRGRLAEVMQVLDFVDRSGMDSSRAFTLLSIVGDGLRRTGSSLALVDAQGRLQRFYAAALDSAMADNSNQQVRLEAIRLLGVSQYDPLTTGDLLQLLLGQGQSPAVQSAVIDALAHNDNARTVTNLMARWQVLTPVLRNELVAASLRWSGRASIVLDAVESGRIGTSEFSSVQINFLRSHPNASVSRRANAVFGAFTPQRPAVVEQFRPALRLTGAAPHGHDLFLSHCAACHQFGTEGHAFGSDLDDARSRGKESLLMAVLEPNAHVPSDYASYVVETKNGEALIGLIGDENPTTITLKQPDAGESVWPRTNIQSMQPRPWSLMPEGLEQGLTQQDMADLLEFVRATP